MSQLSYNTAIHLEATTHLVANSYSDEACFQSTLSMDPGQYQNRPQALGLSLGYSYDGTSLQSSQSLLPMPSNDGLPRVPNQQLMNLYPHNVYNYSIAPSMSIPQSSNDWVLPSQSSPGFDNQINNTCYSYGGDLACMDQGTNHPRDANIPRSWMQCDPSMLDDNSMFPNYDSATYMLGPVREASTSDSLVEEHPESSRDFARLSICHSPKFENGSLGADTFSYQRAPGPRLLASESSDDSLPGSREMTTIDMEDPTTVDEPYAKLIYRALMSAPDHSMVLQEIYQWFRDNTTKGSSDTKGWMNSIRHNLSMNAAFKKTERKILGDETKKSTEWVLEDFAIRDGVQSTTRYRTKSTGVKKILRSDNPTPSKQTSGRKGGICSSKGKFQRRSKDERSDMRQSTPRFDLGGRSNFSFEDMTPQAAQRQLSPLTPTPESMPASSPFFMPKVEQFDVPYEDMYTLEEVQGVYADDTPLFSNNHGQVFHGAHAICASRY